MRAMNPSRAIRLLLAAAALAALQPALAVAQPPAASGAPPVGAEVKDDKGKAVGKVEKIIPGPDGRPKQALVRVDRVLRALPVEALQRQGDAYVAVLTRAEIAALPPAD